ncbi:recombinase family protein [Nocardia sp. NPDC051990]|uniref:recombinase family protein n=1 Tax=Nocardia sp. NPDC051990 TaxID=3155285 RepID=UPI0034200A36
MFPAGRRRKICRVCAADVNLSGYRYATSDRVVQGSRRARGGSDGARSGIYTSTAVGRMFFQILSAIAEFEHALMSERTRDGLAAARARVRTGGQKPKLDPRQAFPARQMYDELDETGKHLVGNTPTAALQATRPDQPAPWTRKPVSTSGLRHIRCFRAASTDPPTRTSRTILCTDLLPRTRPAATRPRLGDPEQPRRAVAVGRFRPLRHPSLVHSALRR